MSVSDIPEDSIISEINMTPLVDISLVLVIIFMVIAPFFSHLLKQITLPTAGTASLNDQNSIKISVFEDGTLAVNTTVVKESEMGGAILAEIGRVRSPWLIMRADGKVRHGRVMEIVRLAKKSGVERVAFAVTPKIEGGAQ